MIESRYQPSEVESRIYAAWEAGGAFRAGRPERAKAEPYCIVIPPPNVTGSLHMGHALNNTLQDILCRFERMRGKDVLWQVGTDHAGIATQAVVERQLMERQQPSSRAMGREAFIKRVWEWKAESGGTIISQLKRLGASCDWSRERFTMGEQGDPSEQMLRAVTKAFVDLYNQKLIYKARRPVNWDSTLKTAISDLEVQQVETKGQLWHIKYPVEGSDEFIVVATTRPETMLGDVAVAVHPHNERLKHLIDKTAILPLVGRRIPIIADEYADPEKGSGAVKITPAHDKNDFEVAQRYNRTHLRDLRPITVLDAEAFLSLSNPFDVEGFLSDVTPILTDVEFISGLQGKDPASMRARVIEKLVVEGLSDRADTISELDGLFRDKARKRVIELLADRGLIDKVESHTHVVPHGDRSGAVIEDRLTFQWFVNAKALAQPAIQAIRDGLTTFVPKNWEKTFFDWMENIQPWCISRQIWWGHRIPVWYGFMRGNNKGALRIASSNTFESVTKEFVAVSENQAIEDAKLYYETTEIILVANETDALNLVNNQREQPTFKTPIWRDEDVLDTWFSSALWPFSTLGWPDQTAELKRFYPTSALVTGFDIIFFWVARMMMMGLHFMKQVPFQDVYIHALVRDERGQKMSKSKGNVIDPLAVIDEYGADALRFTLAAMAAQGRDIKLSAQRVEGYRNFATKLWNAARFTEMNGCVRDPAFDPRNSQQILNRWIAHETAKATQEVTTAIQAYKFNDAAGAIYRFVWNVYCDWYLELIKPVLSGPDSAAKNETRAAAVWALDQILALLHPFMPFVTEELWTVTASPKRNSLLALAQWPSLEGIGDAQAEAEIGWVIDLITTIRSVRAEMNVNVALPLVMIRVGDQVWERAQRWSEFIQRMAKISSVTRVPTAKPGTLQLVVRGEIAGLELAGLVDLAAERARLAKEMAKCDADIARVDAKLANPNFVARAPEEVVEEENEKRDEAQTRKVKIVEALRRLEGAE